MTTVRALFLRTKSMTQSILEWTQSGTCVFGHVVPLLVYMSRLIQVVHVVLL